MSSVQVLLAGLQDPQQTLSCGEQCRATLTNLLAVCQFDDARRELLSYSSLDVLGSFVLAAESALATLDIVDVLLEILTALQSDRHHNAKHRIASQPSLLAFPMKCVRVFTQRRMTKKRNRIIRVSMELLWHLNFTEPAKMTFHQEQLIIVLMRLLENPEEECSLLVYAADMLSSIMDDHEGSVRTAAKYNAIPTLLRLLNMAGDRMDLKRSLFDAVSRIASVDEFVSILVANSAIHYIAVCLRGRTVNRPVEVAALRLLERLCEESQVYGHVINEELVPVLFHLLERSSSIDALRAACGILERVAEFARRCKLDLSPFINTSLPCRGSMLVECVTTHGQDQALVLSAFRFFAHTIDNPSELPALMNSDVFEGLLLLYIIHCGGTGNNALDLAAELVAIVTRLSRSRINGMNFAREDQSLPALFLLLKRNTHDHKFAANVFALLARHLGLKATTAKKASTVSGFVGIAIELLLQHAQQSKSVEMMDANNFLREVMLCSDGGEVVLACGGVSLYRYVMSHRRASGATTKISRAPLKPDAGPIALSLDLDPAALALHAERVACTVMEMLGTAIANAVSHTATASQRDQQDAVPVVNHRSGHDHNQVVETMVRREDRTASREQDTRERERLRLPSYQPGKEQGHQLASHLHDVEQLEGLEDGDTDGDHEDSELDHEEQDDDDEDGENDDGSDCDGDEPEQADASDTLSHHVDSDPNYVGATDDSSLTQPSSRKLPVATVPLHLRGFTPGLVAVDFTSLQEHPFYYVDSEGTRYPKHPYRHGGQILQQPTTSLKKDPFLLIHDVPSHSEPCQPLEPAVMATLIEQATRRREGFLAADPHARARVVYENTTAYAVDGKALEVAPVSPYSPYEVPESSSAFSASQPLMFDSCFESGNLERAIQIGESEYDLVLRRDFHTNGHTQWFYFAISNVSATVGLKYRFNIVNLCKPDSLFNQGLRPVVYSIRDAHERRTGWRRAGDDIFYYPNTFARPSPAAKATVLSSGNNDSPSTDPATTTTATATATFWTLSFTLEFTTAEDTYLIAHSYPYTFTDHQRHLHHVLHHHRASKRRAPQVLKHSVLCTTVGGRPCDLLTVTDFTASTQELRTRRGVLLTARVHPGEPQASWIMRGIIDFLVGGSETARVLRRLFVFSLVPMLNPDGVWLGNSRCSLSACDLNRQWHAPSSTLHPTIHYAKELVRSEHGGRGIVLVCDLHGHSRKKNVFLYGCDTKKRPNPLARGFAKQVAMHASAKRFVSFPDCSFKMSRDKETTARVVLTKELWLPWCFTLEASFCGASFGELQGAHFHTSHLQQVGMALCEALFPACITDRSLRDKVVALVDDGSVSIASYVDSHLRENGIVSDASSIRLEPPTGKQLAPPSQTPRREKGATKKEATQRRRRSESKQETKKTHPTKSPRRLTERRSTATTAVMRRRSSPADVPVGEEDVVIAPRLGKKQSRRRQSAAAAVATDELPTKLTDQPLLRLLDTMVPPDEEDTQLYKLQSIVRASSSSTSSSSSKPPTPETTAAETAATVPIPPPCSPVLPRRRKTMPTTLPSGRCPVESASVFEFSVHDAVPMILPPPVGELLPSKSPKPPTASLRFKGGGRQYAAVTPAARSVHATEKPGPMANAVGYEADLINASSISLRQRATATASGIDTRRQRFHLA